MAIIDTLRAYTEAVVSRTDSDTINGATAALLADLLALAPAVAAPAAPASPVSPTA